MFVKCAFVNNCATLFCYGLFALSQHVLICRAEEMAERKMPASGEHAQRGMADGQPPGLPYFGGPASRQPPADWMTVDFSENVFDMYFVCFCMCVFNCVKVFNTF